MADDVLAVHDTAASDAARVVGIGHSMGGASLVMAEIASPGRFSALVLVEPIIFGSPHARDASHPLVALALRRREVFESRAAIRLAYGAKPPFDAWHPDSLDGYIEGGFVDSDAGVRLACSPLAESEVFTAAGAHGAWERLGEVAVPVTILYGAETDTYPPGHAEALADRFARATATRVSGTGHFLPMEQPGVVVDAVNESLDAVS